MSLFDRLLEQQLRPLTAPRQTFAEKREQWLKEARAKAERGETLPPSAPTPPPEHCHAKQNRELAEAIVSTYRTPVVPSPPPPAPVDLKGPLVARGSCKAIDAETGRQCRLPAHPHAPDQHRSERGPFHRLALPGQTKFTRREALDAQASSRSASPFTTPQGD